MFKRLLLFASILLALAMLGSCDDNKSTGGGGSPPQAETDGNAAIAIRGLTTVSSRGTTTYRAVLALNGKGVKKYQWSIKGHAAIAGPNDGRTVEADITGPEGGGEFTLSLKVKISTVGWVTARDYKVIISPYPQFRIVLHNPINGTLTPTSRTGSGTITASQEYVEYQNWSLYFVGNTTTFPDMINVRVQANNGCAFCDSNWANGPGGNIYRDFPKQGGGSVGLGGTVYNAGANRPYLRTPGGQTNWVGLLADGVQTMQITINR